MKWTWPFVSRAQHEAVLADRERIRGERDQFAKDRDSQRAAAETAARKFAEADADNRRLNGRNLELGKRLSALSESDPEYAAQLEGQVAELQKRLADTAQDGEWRGRARRAEKRVKHLEKELDNALGMPATGILPSAPWQPGYQDPTPDAGVRS